MSPMSGMTVQEIATHINSHGGFALIADYGHDGIKEDTFRVRYISDDYGDTSYACVHNT